VTEAFQVLSVRGRSVRVQTGAAHIDLQVEEVGGGRFYVRKPQEVFLHPDLFLAIVGSVIRAYRESLEGK